MLKRRNLKQSEGQKCSSFGINNTATFKAVMEDIFKGLKYVVVPDDCWEPIPNQDFYGNIQLPFNPNKGKIWITNGVDNQMVEPTQIPKGWYKGRVKVHTKSGRKKILNQLRENNPNAKKYKIVFRDGTEEVVKQLSTWARENGHSYSNIKSIVHRTKYKKERQYECYNSPTYYIKEIVPL